MKTFTTLFKRSFMHGLLYFLPLILTVYVLYLVLLLLHRLLDFSLAVIPPDYRDYLGIVICTEAIAFILLVILISLVGYSLQTFPGRFLRDQLVRFLRALPLLKSIYSALAQTLEILFKNRKQLFSNTVIIDYPHPGKLTVGFATGELAPALAPVKGTVYRTVFVPTTPNPTSGYLLLVPPDFIKVAGFPAETGLKLIVSGGVVEEYPAEQPPPANQPHPASPPLAGTECGVRPENQGGRIRWRRAFCDGLIVMVPAALTVYLGYLLLNWIYGYLSPVTTLLPDGLRDATAMKLAAETVALMILVGLIAFLGLIVHSVVGALLQKPLLRLLDALPGVRMIFRGIMTFVQLLYKNEFKNFSKVVLVEFPYPGCWAFGFATGEATPRLCGNDSRKHVKVFVAGTPNPTTGFLIIVPETEVIITGLTVEQGLRIVLTGGILSG